MSERDDDKSRESDAPEKDKRWWAEMMRETALTGLSTIFMTEDSVRKYLKEKNLPKELASLILDGFGKKKDDFYGLLAKEFGRVLTKIDLSREVGKFLEKHHVHFEAKISFEPKENAGAETSNGESESTTITEKKSS